MCFVIGGNQRVNGVLVGLMMEEISSHLYGVSTRFSPVGNRSLGIEV